MTTDEPSVQPEDPAATTVVAPAPRRSRRWMWVTAGLLALLVAGFVVGFAVADDGAEVRDQKATIKAADREIEELKAESADAAERADDAETELSDLGKEHAVVQEQLAAERNLSGKGKAVPVAASDAPTGELMLGAASKVGDFTVKPTALDKRGGSGDTVKYRLTLTVKNDGKVSSSPFCGGSSAKLIDQQQREFDGDSVISEGGSEACSDLQPGLSGKILIDFTVPNDVKPAVISLGIEYDGSDAVTWTVR